MYIGDMGSEFRFNLMGNSNLQFRQNCGTSGGNSDGSEQFTILYNSGGIRAHSYANYSDERAKETISTITDGLSVVNQLNPTSYYVRTFGTEVSDADNCRRYGTGFVAQEVQQVSELSHLVVCPCDCETGEDKSDTEALALNYIGIIPYLVASIKQVKARIEVLENNQT